MKIFLKSPRDCRNNSCRRPGFEKMVHKKGGWPSRASRNPARIAMRTAMAGCMISRKVIGPSERPMRFSHPRLSASSTIHLPRRILLNWPGFPGWASASATTRGPPQHVLNSCLKPLSRDKWKDRVVRRSGGPNEELKPGSSRSSPGAYLQSMRPRTAGDLAVGAVLGGLHHGDQGELPSGQCRLSAPGIEVGEVAVEKTCQCSSRSAEVGIPLGGGGAGDRLGDGRGEIGFP